MSEVRGCSLLLVILLSIGCTAANDDDIDLVHDACERVVLAPALDTTSHEREAIEIGAELWNESARTRLELGEPRGDAVVPVRFQDAATAFRGFYDDVNGIVFVNRRLEDVGAESITIAHELGHAFGLVHVPRDERPSVMNPGNLVELPTIEDVEALALLWGRCDER
jgi:hypothetical protein